MFNFLGCYQVFKMLILPQQCIIDSDFPHVINIILLRIILNTPVEEIKDLNKRGKIPSSCIRKFNIAMIAIFPKLIYGINGTFTTPVNFFCRKWQGDPKIYMETQGRRDKTILKKNNKIGSFKCCQFKD